MNEFFAHAMGAFNDEMEKTAFAPVRFIVAGAKKWGRALTSPTGTSLTRRFGGASAERAGGIGAHMKQIYESGKSQIGKSGAPGGVLGGAKALARSRYGQMATVPIAGAAAVKAIQSSGRRGY